MYEKQRYKHNSVLIGVIQIFVLFVIVTVWSSLRNLYKPGLCIIWLLTLSCSSIVHAMTLSSSCSNACHFKLGIPFTPSIYHLIYLYPRMFTLHLQIRTHFNLIYFQDPIPELVVVGNLFPSLVPWKILKKWHHQTNTVL